MVYREESLGFGLLALTFSMLCILVIMPLSLVTTSYIEALINPQDEIVLSVLDYAETLLDLRRLVVDTLTNTGDLRAYLAHPDMLKELLDSLDTDKDQNVTITEFVQCLAKRDLKLSGKRLQRVTRLIDVDYSGTVELSELEALIRSESDAQTTRLIEEAFYLVVGRHRAQFCDVSKFDEVLEIINKESLYPLEVDENPFGSANKAAPHFSVKEFFNWYQSQLLVDAERYSASAWNQEFESEQSASQWWWNTGAIWQVALSHCVPDVYRRPWRSELGNTLKENLEKRVRRSLDEGSMPSSRAGFSRGPEESQVTQADEPARRQGHSQGNVEMVVPVRTPEQEEVGLGTVTQEEGSPQAKEVEQQEQEAQVEQVPTQPAREETQAEIETAKRTAEP